jgi:hypothetical protein
MSALLELVALRSRAQARAVHECSPKLQPRVHITRGLRTSTSSNHNCKSHRLSASYTLCRIARSSARIMQCKDYFLVHLRRIAWSKM